ncbi:hypothetical protein FA13DRAFT_1091022 [Coprinellus micaceus]|uniref:Uncharacterized protein n=1 Tax=Coprinellus micaceus TaxID=71717 RepID=A0A4Y7TSP8_COPMI|nr:hypothetical protein FA13DRAFT_1091022 [Coprinellus micaceus]
MLTYRLGWAAVRGREYSPDLWRRIWLPTRTIIPRLYFALRLISFFLRPSPPPNANIIHFGSSIATQRTCSFDPLLASAGDLRRLYSISPPIALSSKKLISRAFVARTALRGL